MHLPRLSFGNFRSGHTTLVLLTTCVLSSHSAHCPGQISQTDSQHSQIVDDLLISRMLELDVVNYGLEARTVDWDSITDDAAKGLVWLYCAEKGSDLAVISRNAHQAASDPRRAAYEQDRHKMSQTEKRRTKDYLIENDTRQTRQLHAVIDRQMRIKAILANAISKTAPILAAKGEFDIIMENREASLQALLHAAGDPTHKYNLTSLFTLLEHFKDVEVPQEFVVAATANFELSEEKAKVGILKILVASGDVEQAMELFSQFVARKQPTAARAFRGNDSSGPGIHERNVQEISDKLDAGGEQRTSYFNNGPEPQFVEFSPRDIANLLMDRAKNRLRMADTSKESIATLQLGLNDLEEARLLLRDFTQDEFTVYTAIEFRSLQAKMRTKLTEINRKLENLEEADANKSLAIRAFDEWLKQAQRLPGQAGNDFVQKEMRLADYYTTRAEAEFIFENPDAAIRSYQELLSLTGGYGDWINHKVVAQAYVEKGDYGKAAGLLGNCLNKYLSNPVFSDEAPITHKSVVYERLSFALPILMEYRRYSEISNDQHCLEDSQRQLQRLLRLLD